MLKRTVVVAQLVGISLIVCGTVGLVFVDADSASTAYYADPELLALGFRDAGHLFARRMLVAFFAALNLAGCVALVRLSWDV